MIVPRKRLTRRFAPLWLPIGMTTVISRLPRAGEWRDSGHLRPAWTLRGTVRPEIHRHRRHFRHHGGDRHPAPFGSRGMSRTIAITRLNREIRASRRPMTMPRNLPWDARTTSPERNTSRLLDTEMRAPQTVQAKLPVRSKCRYGNLHL